MQASTTASQPATDVGMHGLLASQSCYHSVLPRVFVHCGPVVDFFITKQTSLHLFDFFRNRFYLLSIQFAVECDKVHAMPKIYFKINNKQFELTPEQYVLKVSINK